MIKTSRRDFLYLSAAGFGVVGIGGTLSMLVDSMNPAKDTTALASIEVDIKGLGLGQEKTVTWRGKPIFIKHRTKDEIQAVETVSIKTLIDPETDKERFGRNQNYLVVVGVCTHLGCIPHEREGLGKNGEQLDGWICACHGSVYDGSGRVIKGPAPKNLEVPPYEFINNNTLKIG